ncbi:MAG TPA: sigma-70 family RNA polymerase sigma factor [Anaerolineales bacterium]|nr:sigma-70 family RNA polymerase sigma factor [Anaerolineales bacterium]HNJ15432.1 sigma-70 family RNA polymerase sigma factor [Anaerolineales bacterium]
MKPFTRPKSTQLEQAFDRYYPSVFRFFRYRGADADTANDLAASVFERALIAIHQYDPRKAQIQTWLFAIARNLSINHWKAEKETLPLDDELPEDDPPLEELIIQTHDKEHVLAALQTLDKRSREIIALKFSGELSNREISELTGLTESNIGVILYRSLAKLRRELLTSQMEATHDR